MKYLTGIALLCLASCAPKAIVMEPIASHATVVSESSSQTAAQAAKVKRNNEAIGRDIQNLQAEINKAKADAERLRKQGQATQDELEANARAWEAVSIKNAFLEAAAKRATIDASELQAAAERAKAESAKLKDEVKKQDKVVADLKTELNKQAVDAARGRALKHLIWLLIGIVAVYLIIRFILPLIKPL